MMTDYTEQPARITCTLCGVPFWTRRPERNTCSPCLAGVEQMEAETKALAFACNDTERTFKGRDAEISALKERVVEAAIEWDDASESDIASANLNRAVAALIDAREKPRQT